MNKHFIVFLAVFGFSHLDSHEHCLLINFIYKTNSFGHGKTNVTSNFQVFLFFKQIN